MIKRAEWHAPRLGRGWYVKHLDYLRSLSLLEWFALVVVLVFCLLISVVKRPHEVGNWLAGAGFFLVMYSITAHSSEMWVVRSASMRRLRHKLGESGYPVIAHFYSDDYLGADYGVVSIDNGLLRYTGNRTDYRLSAHDLKVLSIEDHEYINEHLIKGCVRLNLEDDYLIRVEVLTLYGQKEVLPESQELYEEVAAWFKRKQTVANAERLLPPTTKNSGWFNEHLWGTYRFLGGVFVLTVSVLLLEYFS